MTPPASTLVSLVATITNPLDSEAEKLDVDVAGTNAAKSYANGVLTLSGMDFFARSCSTESRRTRPTTRRC